MKILVTFSVLIAISVATPAEFVDDVSHCKSRAFKPSAFDNDGVYYEEDLLKPRSKFTLDITEYERVVSFYYYNRDQPDWWGNLTQIMGYNFSSVHQSGFDPNKKTKFIIHGWKNNFVSQISTQITDALLQKHDINVFVVDWWPKSKQDYFEAAYAVLHVGEMVGKFMLYLIENFNYDPFNISIVGHSLGAHVAGNAARFVKETLGDGEIDHIIALDPAAPGFYNVTDRIFLTDANYVQVIHTSCKLVGYNTSIGHSDFYPNGGYKQPGCSFINNDRCAHSRSFMYYAESVLTSGFLAHECPGIDSYNQGKCKENQAAFMGEYPVNKEPQGNFFLNTNSKKPFAITN